MPNMKVILIILDGWGVAGPSYGNAIASASTPTINSLDASYPSCLLQASGIAVGLPWGHEGNSEVGHLNIGSGRIILQYLPRIISAIRDESFFKNKALKKAALHVKKNNSSLHLMGLISSGSVHSYIDHLYGLLELAKRERISKVYLHLFTDGKDSPPNEAAKFIKQLNERLTTQNLGIISTIIGRIYSMDRNNNWEYTKKAYDMLTEGKGESIDDLVAYIENSYTEGISDQYIEPARLAQLGWRAGLLGGRATSNIITEGDAVIFFNFREDSARQLTRAFIEEEFEGFPRKKIDNLVFITMTQYDKNIPASMVAFPPVDISNPLAQIFASGNKKQLHIAESEKYAHITYFFNGLQEKAFKGEERILIPSQGSPHYENYPEMQALKITEKTIENINDLDFILVNFANSDMLAHTGNMQATIKGIETVDQCIKKIITAQNKNTTIIITADHGNAEEMIDPRTGTVKTEHTANPVPFYLIDKNKVGNYQKPLSTKKTKGILADVAPTILELMEIPIPKEITGQSLLPILK